MDALLPKTIWVVDQVLNGEKREIIASDHAGSGPSTASIPYIRFDAYNQEIERLRKALDEISSLRTDINSRVRPDWTMADIADEALSKSWRQCDKEE